MTQYYWLHISSGVDLQQYGPFTSWFKAEQWRKPYYAAWDKQPTEHLPNGNWDDEGSDTWVFITVNPDRTIEAET